MCRPTSITATPTASISELKEYTVTIHAAGTFEVKMTPQPADDTGEAGAFGRFFLDKQFHGDLEGTSKGQMLGATTIEGSGGYVALERITGTLNGRKGSFILQHKGSMSGGSFNLDINTVPDSGTDGLEGVSGQFKIIIEGGKHSWEFDYDLPDTP
ncbi:MAG: DUF3224 domain-containing protein [Gemmatimonadota bacterium]